VLDKMTDGMANALMFVLGAGFAVAPIFVAVVLSIAIFLVGMLFYVVHSGPNRVGGNSDEKEPPIGTSTKASSSVIELGIRGGSGHTRPTSSPR
jgi:hypothetical protein